MRVTTAIRIFCVILAVGCGLLFGVTGYLQNATPDNYTVAAGAQLHIGNLIRGLPIDPDGTDGTDGGAPAGKAADSYRASLRLFGAFPIKEVQVAVSDTPVVTVCGTPFGIKLYTDGVLIVKMSDVITAAGAVNPAADAGLQVGDTIVSIDGRKVTTNEEVAAIINACSGRAVTMKLRRDGVEFKATFSPARPADGDGYRAGLWVRDSTAGVGILTFYEPESGCFAGLGHAVCDTDTGDILSLSEGEIVPARIFAVERGEAGTPGELQGGFEPGTLGKLARNAPNGLYGTLSVFPVEGQSMPVAMRQEVHPGAAQVLTTVHGTRPALYAVEIVQVKYNASAATRHMLVRVTDPALLDAAGGIVQGMSGSPVLQNGRLIGAITHVLVDDPTTGYAIFAENMLETAQSVASENKLKDAS